MHARNLQKIEDPKASDRRFGRVGRALAVAAALASAFAAMAGPVSAADPARVRRAGGSMDWPNWRGPNRDSVSTETGWRTDWSDQPPKTLWRASVGVGYSSVAIADGRLYTMGNDKDTETDSVYCLDAETGEVIWRFAYACPPAGGGHPGPRCTPTVDGKNVYTLSNMGHLLCLDAASGKARWGKDIQKALGAKPAQWGFACSPLIVDNLLILDVGPTVALEKGSGRVVWKSDPYTPSYSTPSVFEFEGKRRLAVFNGFGFVILRLAGGQELCRYRWRTSWGVNAATPIVSGGRVFVSSGYGKGCALLGPAPGEPTVVWKSKAMRNHVNSCVLWKGHLYGFDGQAGSRGQLTCLNFETGQVKWSEGGLKVGSLMIAGGKLIAMCDGGELIVAEASPDAYKELGRVKVLSGECWTMPVLSGGRIYCRNTRGDLVCLDVKRTPGPKGVPE